MIFFRLNWKWLLIVWAVAGVVLPSLAQRHGQPIIFSAPDTELATNPAPPLVPDAVKFDFSRAFSSPNVATPPSLQPAPAPMISPLQAQAAQQAQKELERKKNWTLMTPAEILGVPTLEKISGVSERNAAGEIKNQTPLERYFARQQVEEYAAMTNEAAAINATANWNLQGDEPGQPSSPGFTPPRNNSLFGTPQNNNVPNANQGVFTAWPKTFGSQTAITPVAPTTEQIEAAKAEAEEFQKLLQPNLAAQPATTPSPFAPSPSAQSSLFPQPANPAGAPVPVSSGVIVPQSVAPLPTVTGNNNPSTTPVAPEWKRKLPPWMSQSGTDNNF
jgi:hypothetical protein